MLFAATTQRTIGFVILAIVFVGGILYIYFNIRGAKAEVGSELELAPNRSPYLSDEELEGRHLDRSLAAGLVLLTVVSVSLPLYWLGEPGRHDGLVADTDRVFTDRGRELYTEGAKCVSCHGPDGTGGSVSKSLIGSDGNFIAQVSWKAPALNTVLSRFSEDEVLHVLNFGRNGVMPAWGGPGGGPLSEQELDTAIFYLRSIQIDEATIRSEVSQGIRDGVAEKMIAESPADWAVAIRDAEIALAALDADNTDADNVQAIADASGVVNAARSDADAAISSAIDQWLAAKDGVVAAAEQMAMDNDPTLASKVSSAASEAEKADAQSALSTAALELLAEPGRVPDQQIYLDYGKIIFSNQATGGTYSCARCHTSGWSYDATAPRTIAENGTSQPLLSEYKQGGGFFGPNLTNGTTLDQFETAAEHAAFVNDGQSIGKTYGKGGSGGNGQMPGFGPRTDDGVGVTYPGLLTTEQINAVVAFERNL